MSIRLGIRATKEARVREHYHHSKADGEHPPTRETVNLNALLVVRSLRNHIVKNESCIGVPLIVYSRATTLLLVL